MENFQFIEVKCEEDGGHDCSGDELETKELLNEEDKDPFSENELDSEFFEGTDNELQKCKDTGENNNMINPLILSKDSVNALIKIEPQDIVSNTAEEDEEEEEEESSSDNENTDIIAAEEVDPMSLMLEPSIEIAEGLMLDNSSSEAIDPTTAMMTSSELQQPAVRRMRKRRSYVCQCCDVALSCAEAFRTHMHAHALAKTHQCRICLKTFAYKYYIDIHKRSHDQDHAQRFKCPICALVLTSNGTLKMHMNTHTRERTYTCAVCARAFVRKDAYRTHMELHVDPAVAQHTYACGQCGKQFVTARTYQRHMLVHVTHLKCDVCSKVFNRSDVLKKHKEMHQLRSAAHTPQHRCIECGKSFLTERYLKMHAKRHTLDGSEKKTIVCPDCGREFRDTYYRAVHCKTHQPDEMQKNACAECGKRFASTWHLKVHQDAHNRQVKHRCPHCAKPFYRTDTWKSHVRKVHKRKDYTETIVGV